MYFRGQVLSFKCYLLFPAVCSFGFYEDANVCYGRSNFFLPFRSRQKTRRRRVRRKERQKRWRKRRKTRVNVLATPCLKDCKRLLMLHCGWPVTWRWVFSQRPSHPPRRITPPNRAPLPTFLSSSSLEIISTEIIARIASRRNRSLSGVFLN